MNIEAITVGEFQANCYVVWNDRKEALIVDAGCDAGLVSEFISKRGLNVLAYLETHGHMDHVSGLAGICATLPAPVYIHAADAAWAFTEANQWLPYYDTPKCPPDLKATLADGMELTIAGFSIRVIATPGHTPGSVCFYFHADNTLFSGDTLFANGVGRTDLPGGSTRELKASLERLTTLPDGTAVLPGHGPATSIGDEKRHNFFMRQKG